MPRLSVVMPVRNGEQTIAQAITSVAVQGDVDLELIVVDDASTDNTVSIASALGEKFSNIRVLRGPGKGAIYARNHGIANSDSEYIAAMDADDVCVPSRFRKQLDALSSDPSLVGVGSRICWFGEKSGLPDIVVGRERCRKALQLFSPICHPSFMCRRDRFLEVGGYSDKFMLADDYSLFSRLSFVGDLMNLPDILLFYRIHGGQLSNTRRTEMAKDMYGVLKAHHQRLSKDSAMVKDPSLLRLGQIALEIGSDHYRQSGRAIRNCLISR